jgi:hypothetical protein
MLFAPPNNKYQEKEKEKKIYNVVVVPTLFPHRVKTYCLKRSLRSPAFSSRQAPTINQQVHPI